MVLHCLVLALLPKHPHLGKGILRNLDCSTVGLLGNRLWPGPLRHKQNIEFGK